MKFHTFVLLKYLMCFGFWGVKQTVCVTSMQARRPATPYAPRWSLRPRSPVEEPLVDPIPEAACEAGHIATRLEAIATRVEGHCYWVGTCEAETKMQPPEEAPSVLTAVLFNHLSRTQTLQVVGYRRLDLPHREMQKILEWGFNESPVYLNFYCFVGGLRALGCCVGFCLVQAETMNLPERWDVV